MKVITTNDGSKSIYLETLNEHYHSIHGALQEAKHVFFKMGWDKVVDKSRVLSILEIGFGTGLNATLAINQSIVEDQPLLYHSVEKYPVEDHVLKQLDYDTILNSEVFEWIHDLSWDAKFIYPRREITFIKQQLDLLCDELIGKFDLIFFDAFAPNKQPEMWSVNVFQKVYEHMNYGALLTTYCCQGQVKRKLKSVGFDVEKVQGPPGKREMINAWKR